MSPFWSVAFIVKGYGTLVPNPPAIRQSLALVLLLGCKGFAGVTLKIKSKGLPRSRVAFNEITGSTPTFFRVISTTGPKRVNGLTGPNTDMISIGSWFCDVETGWQSDTVTARSVLIKKDTGNYDACQSFKHLLLYQ